MSVDVLGDGNCFYRAACFGLYGNDARHAELREQLADFVLQSGSMLDGVISMSGNSNLYAKHIDSLITAGKSVGEEAIVALAHMREREVHVYTAYVEPLVYQPAGSDVKSEPVCLAFFEPGHYRAVTQLSAFNSGNPPSNDSVSRPTHVTANLNLQQE